MMRFFLRRLTPFKLIRFGAAAGVFILALGLLLGPAWSQASEHTCRSGLTARIQQDYMALRSFRGRFVQEDELTDGQMARAEGKIAYLKPGRMRWAYAPPNEQLVVTDGETVWLHDPILDNVTVQPLGDLTQGTPLAFLLGAGNLQADFTCRPFSIRPPGDGLEYVELVPRKAIPTLAFIQLGAIPKSARIASLRMVDNQGNVRSVRMLDLVVNVTLQENLFTFEITPDMEVITK